MHNINLRDSYIISLQDNKVVDVSTNDQHIIPDFGYQGMTELTVRGYSESSQEKIVDSSTVVQEVTPDQGYTSLKKVTVNPYELDSSVVVITNNGRVNVTSEKDGLSSVDINVSVSPILQYKEVDSSTNEQSVSADSQYQGLSQVKINPYILDSKTVDSSTNTQTVVSDKDGLSQVTVNPYVLDSSSATIEKNGTYQFTSENDGLSSVTVDVSIDSRVPQSKTVDSSTNAQEVIPDEGYNALDKVIVNPYELDNKTVDSSTNAQTVVSDKDGLSSVTINPYVLDSKTVDPSTNDQIITSDEDGLSSVTVNKVTSGIDPNIAQGNIKKDVTILGVTGTFEGGDLQEMTVDSSTNSQVIKPGQDYFGLSQVTVNPYVLDSKIVDSSTNEQTVVSDKDGLSSVTVNPYVLDSSIVDPSTNQQVITPEHDGLSQVTVNAVNASIDPNIQPENIASGVNILGVEGTADSIVYPEVVTLRQFDYFESDGSLGFDTGVIPGDNAGNFNVEWRGNLDGDGGFTHGYYPSPDTGYYFRLFGLNRQAYCQFSSSIRLAINIGANTKSDMRTYKMGGNGNKLFINLDGVEKAYTNLSSGTYEVNGSIGIMFNPRDVSPQYAPAGTRVYWFKIYNKDTLIAHYVPVMDQEGNYALYDKVNYRLIYPSDASSTITVGEEIESIQAIIPGNTNLQFKTVDSSSNAQVVSFDSSYKALYSVRVNPVKLQNKSVTPSTSQQSINKDSEYDGLGTVTVNKVTSAIDSNIKAENIADGVTILGVTGNQARIIDNTDAHRHFEYFESNGNFGFDTGVIPGLDASITSMEWYGNLDGDGDFTHGYYPSPDTGYYFRLFGLNRQAYFQFSSSIRLAININGNTKSDMHTYKMGGNGSKLFINLDGVEKWYTNLSSGTYEVNGSIGIMFNPRDVSLQYAPSGTRIYWFNIYKGDTLIRHYIPAMDENDNYALFDTINLEYIYPVDPSVTFTVGPEIVSNLQKKTIDSSTNNQMVYADSSYLGLYSVKVNPYVLDSSTVDASTNQQVITPEHDGLSSVTVNAVTSSIDSNIQAGNIKKDVTILGVTGTVESDPNPVANDNDVIFIDYDGYIRYSYSRSEFLNLTELPPNPVHDGLIAQGWNWTLQQGKDYLTKYTHAFLVIGQNYVSTDGYTHLKISVCNGTQVILRLSTYTADVDWGDGIQSGSTEHTDKSHTYTDSYENLDIRIPTAFKNFGSGTYEFFIWHPYSTTSWISSPSKTREFNFGNSDTFVIHTFNIGSNSSIPCKISIPKCNITYNGTNRLYGYSVPALIFPPETTEARIYGQPEYVSFGHGVSTITCYSDNLNKMCIPETATNLNFSKNNNSFIENLTIPENVTSLSGEFHSIFPSLRVCYVYPQVPPTFSAGSPSSSFLSNCVIYVPHGCLEAYKGATGWSAYSSIMVEMPA